MTKKEEVTKLLWVDMEMSGLEVEKEVPLEIAAIVTDWQFNSLAEFHAVFKQPKHYFDAMDDWNQKHHKASGLLDLVAASGRDPEALDAEFAAWVTNHFRGERAVLAGNSINQDRLFIRRYMPKTEAVLHYRMMDVTSWKVVFNGIYGRKFKKKEAHRALDDIRESIEEFKFYLGFVR